MDACMMEEAKSGLAITSSEYNIIYIVQNAKRLNEVT